MPFLCFVFSASRRFINTRSVLHIVAVPTRAPAPSPSARAAAPVVVASAFPTVLGGRRRADESVVDDDLLLQELLAIAFLNGLLRFVEGGVFDEAVALHTLLPTLSMYHSFTHLDVTSSPVQVQVQVLDGAVFAEHVVHVLLARFFVHVGDDDDPAFDGAHCVCASCGARVAGLGVDGGALGLVDVHLSVVGHGCG